MSGSDDAAHVTFDARPPRVAVIGAGPAGLMAAVAAAGRGASVTVCEQLDRPGAKLLVTGGGRCNLTNTASAGEFMASLGRQGRFAQPALAAMDSEGLREFFAGLGVPTASPDGFAVYPADNSAATVLKALLDRCAALGVTLRPRMRVSRLMITDRRIMGLETDGGTIETDRVVIACGGRSYAQLGGTGGGYELARQAGHAIVGPTPALVGLLARERWPRRLAGVSVPARAWIDLPRQSKAGVAGDVLFTHGGISGPAALNISGDVASLLASGKPVPLRLDVTGRPAAAWLGNFDVWQRRSGTTSVRTLLAKRLPRSLADVLCEQAGLDASATAAHLSGPVRRNLAQCLTGLPLTIIATEGFEAAMVTRGGVSLKQVDPHTLASRLVEGLHFAGEVLDLDGPTGGYNLQAAFSTGYVAGQSAARYALGQDETHSSPPREIEQ